MLKKNAQKNEKKMRNSFLPPVYMTPTGQIFTGSKIDKTGVETVLLILTASRGKHCTLLRVKQRSCVCFFGSASIHMAQPTQNIGPVQTPTPRPVPRVGWSRPCHCVRILDFKKIHLHTFHFQKNTSFFLHTSYSLGWPSRTVPAKHRKIHTKK